jgi:hypothetical protein
MKRTMMIVLSPLIIWPVGRSIADLRAPTAPSW